MKNILILVALFFGFSSSSIIGQAKISDAEVTWYGIDFTAAKMIGSDGFKEPHHIQEKFLAKWNKLMKNEKDKYSIGKFYNKTKVDFNLDLVTERNKLVDPEALVIEKSYNIDIASVEEITKHYGSETARGLGMLFVVESFNKLESKGYIWVTFFDASTGEIIKTKRLEGEAGGFGLRNYWAKSIYNVMKNSKEAFGLADNKKKDKKKKRKKN